jgi:hypothetical protein
MIAALTGVLSKVLDFALSNNVSALTYSVSIHLFLYTCTPGFRSSNFFTSSGGTSFTSLQDPKADGSPLTLADLEANKIICSELKKL